MCHKNVMLGIKPRTLDWDKVVDILIDEDIYSAYVGLAEDFHHTQGHLLHDYEPMLEPGNQTFGTHLTSMWATPCVYDDVRNVAYECHRELKDDEDVIKTAKSWWDGQSLNEYKRRRTE